MSAFSKNKNINILSHSTPRAQLLTDMAGANQRETFNTKSIEAVSDLGESDKTTSAKRFYTCWIVQITHIEKDIKFMHFI